MAGKHGGRTFWQKIYSKPNSHNMAYNSSNSGQKLGDDPKARHKAGKRIKKTVKWSYQTIPMIAALLARGYITDGVNYYILPRRLNETMHAFNDPAKDLGRNIESLESMIGEYNISNLQASLREILGPLKDIENQYDSLMHEFSNILRISTELATMGSKTIVDHAEEHMPDAVKEYHRSNVEDQLKVLSQGKREPVVKEPIDTQYKLLMQAYNNLAGSYNYQTDAANLVNKIGLAVKGHVGKAELNQLQSSVEDLSTKVRNKYEKLHKVEVLIQDINKMSAYTRQTTELYKELSTVRASLKSAEGLTLMEAKDLVQTLDSTLSKYDGFMDKLYTEVNADKNVTETVGQLERPSMEHNLGEYAANGFTVLAAVVTVWLYYRTVRKYAARKLLN